MTTDMRIGMLVVALKMVADNHKQQAGLNEMQGKLFDQLLDILTTQRREIDALKAKVERLESWSFN